MYVCTYDTNMTDNIGRTNLSEAKESEKNNYELGLKSSFTYPLLN